MTDRPCPHCGAALPVGDVLCRGGRTNLRLDLEAVPQILADLDLALSRQTSMPPSHSGGGCPDGCRHGDDDPTCVAGVQVDVDERASEARLTLVTCLHGWVRIWGEQHPLPPDTDTIGPACERCRHSSCRELRHEARRLRDQLLATPEGQAALLWSWLPMLGAPAWLPDLAQQLHDALAEAGQAIERPADSTVVGRCPGCGVALYAPEGAAMVRCRACGASGLRDDIREASLAESRKLVTIVQMAEVLQVPERTVRSWRQRGKLTLVRYDMGGRPLYRVSDGQRLKARGEDTEETTT